MQRYALNNLILKIINKILSAYKPSKLIGASLTKFEAPAGEKIAVNLLDPTTTLFKTIISIVSKGYDYLQSPSLKSKLRVSETVTNALKCLLEVAEKSNTLLDLAKDCNNAPFMQGFDKVLLAFNPQTMKADHLYNIFKYTTFFSWLPEATPCVEQVLKIIDWFCKHAHTHMEKALIKSIDQSMLYSFVEIVESQGVLSINLLKSIITALYSSQTGVGKVLAETATGFTGKGFENANSVTGRYLIHSALTLIDQNDTEPEILNLCYELLYRLCGSTRSGKETLRYLRNKDFVINQLENWDHNVFGKTTHGVRALSWLLKIVALEIFISSKSNARDRISKITKNLVNTSFIKNILSNVELYYEKAEPPKDEDLKVFDLSKIQSLISMCQRETNFASDPQNLVNLDKLFALIDSEIKPSLDGMTRAVQENVETELKLILEFLREHNLTQTHMTATNMLISAMRQVSYLFFKSFKL